MLFVTLLALAGAQTAAVEPDTLLTVTVQKLPATYRQAPVVRLEFNANGAVVKCDVEKKSGNAAIDRVACQQAVQIKLESEGKVAPEPRSATIAFTTEPAK